MMSGASQLALDFAPPAVETGVSERLEGLLGILTARGGWMTRRELEPLGFGERELRELGEADERIFSYPGSPGYKHFDLVTDAEFDPCIALKHQGEKMVAKWLRYQRRWHRRGKPRGDADAVG